MFSYVSHPDFEDHVGASAAAPDTIAPGVLLSDCMLIQEPVLLEDFSVVAVAAVLDELEANLLEVSLMDGGLAALPVDPSRRVRVDAPADGTGNLLKFLGGACTFIDRQLRELDSGAVLIHCWNGRSRGPAVAMAWLMRRNRWTVRQALEHVASIRPGVAPSPNLMEQLEVWERCEYYIWYDVGRTVPKPAYREWLREQQ